MTITACDRYIADDGPRELVMLDGAGGSRLLVDRRESDGADARLLAHLAVDEPDENARLVCREFLADERRGARRLAPGDFGGRGEGEHRSEPRAAFRPRVLTDAAGRRYCCVPAASRSSCAGGGRRAAAERRRVTLSARDVVGALEAYEPVCAITRAAVARYRHDRANFGVDAVGRAAPDRVEPDRAQPAAARGGARRGARARHAASARSRCRAGGSSATAAATAPARRAGSPGVSGCCRPAPAAVPTRGCTATRSR